MDKILENCENIIMLMYRPNPANILGNSTGNIIICNKLTKRMIKVSNTDSFDILTNMGIIDTKNSAITSNLKSEFTPGMFKNSSLGISNANKIKCLYFTINFFKKTGIHWQRILKFIIV